jgi:hypothetical protein
MVKQKKNNFHSKLFKYLIIAFIVFSSIKYIPENKVIMKENLMISAIASITFAILDMISPSISTPINQNKSE